MKVKIAYFSAEIGTSHKIPSYSGGLGILAGDHLKAAADLSLPICGVTLLYKEGYLKQRIGDDGWQTEQYPKFHPEILLRKLPIQISLLLRGRDVKIAIWQDNLTGHTGHEVPIFYLDTDIPENHPDDRKITMRLYSGDETHRLLQESILGFGGILALDAMHFHDIETYHMNEGHCSFLTVALRDLLGSWENVKNRCVFTTHTPVPAGHDDFSFSMAKEILGDLLRDDLAEKIQNSSLHMTKLGIEYSRAINGVSKLHGEVSQKMFPNNKIGYITNGVHHLTWAAAETRKVFDMYLPGWRENPEILKNACEIPNRIIWRMHQQNKRRCLDYVNAQEQVGFAMERLTIGFARRAAGYKRALLLFRDAERLKKISQGRLQIVFAGKAHPKDEIGKKIIRDVVQAGRSLFPDVLVTFVENYNMWLGRLITSSVDVWLNTPIRPHEASGTSGMKAALNGIPNFSILDGWWAEGFREGKNGWAIGNPNEPNDEADVENLYQTLENEIIPDYYEKPNVWAKMMKESIVTAADFTAQRMVGEYETVYEISD